VLHFLLSSAAASHGTGYMLSTWSTTSIEDIAQATKGSVKWMQLYVYKVCLSFMHSTKAVEPGPQPRGGNRAIAPQTVS